MIDSSEGSLSPAEKKLILRKRAKMLARVPDDKTTDEGLEIIEFSLAQERYGIETCYIRAVHPLKDLTPVPGIPGFILGVISLRGEIVSVVDMKKFLNLPGQGLTDLNRVLVLCHDHMEFGILADELIGAKKVPWNNIQTSMPLTSDSLAKYFKGITSDGLIILDGGNILSDEGMLVDKKE